MKKRDVQPERAESKPPGCSDGPDPIPEEAHAKAEALAKSLLSMPPKPRTGKAVAITS